MKRYIIFLATILFVLPTFLACSDDDNDTRPSDGAPGKAAVGVYGGTFTRVKEGETATEENQGTIAITEAAEAYTANFALTCTPFSVEKTVLANITYSSGGFAFNNISSSNELGNPFVGRIDDNGAMTVKFTLKQRSGRQTITYNYTFVGTKVINE